MSSHSPSARPRSFTSAQQPPHTQQRPGMRQQVAKHSPSSHPKRQITSSARLQWWRAIIAVVSLVAAVVVPLVLVASTEASSTSMYQTQRHRSLQTVEQSLWQAETAVTSGLASETSEEEIRNTYQQHVAVALEELESGQLSGLRSEDGRALSVLMIEYVVALDHAVVSGDTVDVLQASRIMDETIVPMIASEATAINASIQESSGTNTWLIIVSGGFLLVCVIATGRVMITTKRVINLGLIAAVVLSAAGTYATYDVTLGESEPRVQAGAVVDLHVSEDAATLIRQMQAYDSRVALGVAGQRTKLTDAKTQLGTIDYGLLGGDPTSVQAAVDERLGGSTQPVDTEAYDTFFSAVSNEVAQIRERQHSEMNEAGTALSVMTITIPVLFIGAGVAGIIGISRPLRRYW